MRTIRRPSLFRFTALVLADLFTVTSIWGAAPLAIPQAAIAPRQTTASGQPTPTEPAPLKAVPQSSGVERVPMAALAPVLAAVVTPRCPSSCQAFFGPQRYDRTTGAPNVYTAVVAVPSSVVSPYWLRVQNGESDGSHRVSSASIWINDTQVAGPSDFNQNVTGFDRSVTLTPTTTLKVKLQSSPGSYLYINFCGQPVDHTAPQISVTQPTPGSTVATAQPHLRVHYVDTVGSGETWASGVSLSTLVVTLDGTDRTSLFTKGSAEADADVPSNLALADGSHTLTATIKDGAGNSGTTTASFSVVTQAPTLTVTSPSEGATVGSSPASVTGSVTSADPAVTVQCRVGAGTVTASRSGSSYSCSVALAEGPNAITVTANDTLSHSASVVRNVVLDTAPPVVAITAPVSGSFTKATPIAVSGTATDAGSTVTNVAVMVNGVTAAVQRTGTTTFTFSASVPAPPPGDVVLVATGTDAFGHSATSPPVTVHADRTGPQITLVQPATGSTVGTPTPHLRLHYQDLPGLGESAASGVNSGTLTVAVDGTDRSSLFAKGASDADADIPAGLALSDGPHTVTASIQDAAGNAGSGTGVFTVDSQAPNVIVAQPAEGALLRATPVAVTGSVTDADPATTIQCQAAGAPVPAQLVAGAFTCSVTLGEGANAITVTATDSFAHQSSVVRHVTLDATPPVVTISTPLSGSFTNAAQLAVSGTASDAGATTATLTVTVNGVSATVQRTGATSFDFAATIPVAGGADVLLQATATDPAGNAGVSPSVAVHVDKTPPQIGITEPASGTTLGTGSVLVQVHYSDAPGSGEPVASGVNPLTLTVVVDGADRTASFTHDAADAQATLSLADGAHSVTASVKDVAGNTGTTTGSFTTNTQPPAVTIVSPAEGALVNVTPIAVSGSISAGDPNSSVQCQAATSTAATRNGAAFTCSVGLAEGANTVTVAAADSFNRQGSATRHVTLDSIPPVVDIQSPASGSSSNATQIAVTGTVSDAGSTTSSVTVSVNGVAATVQRSGTATFTYSATVPAATGDLVLQATATDAAGNSGVSPQVTVHVDDTAPVVTITSPAGGAILKAPLHVTGTVADAAPGQVTVNDVPATVSNGGFSGDVSAPDGPLTLTAKAWDAAGNSATATVDIVVDSTPPVIVVASPAEGALTSATSLHVSGTVDDVHPSTLTVAGQVVALSGNNFDADVPLGSEGAASIAIAATDVAGNAGSHTLSVVVDRTPPQLQIAAPAEGAVLTVSQVQVQGTVSDANGVTLTVDGTPATVTGQGWQATTTLAGGDHTFAVVATDGAGNTTTATRHVFVDLSEPVVVIATPTAGALTRQATIDVAGTVSGVATGTITVSVASMPATVSPNGAGSFAFTASGVPLAEGDNTLQAVATTSGGRSANASVLVTRDSTRPVVVVTAPDTLAKGQTGPILATATDANAITQVVLKVNGLAVGTFASAPYSAVLSVPDAASPGDTLVVSAEATDAAGNVGTASRATRIAGSGVVVGQVLDDSTSLPLGGASVKLVSGGTGTVETVTDDAGRYSLPVSSSQAVLVAHKDGSTSVERSVMVQASGGTVPVDARLTPVAAVATGGSAPVVSGPVSIVLPDGASVRLTNLSPQGLPALLPLGFSPVVAFDLRSDATVAGPFAAVLTVTGTDALHLVQYDTGLHEWMILAPGLTAGADSTVAVDLPALGSYALVAADGGSNAPTVPAAGQMLTGVAMAPIPADATSATAVDPATLPPSGGKSQGTLALQTTTLLPSGTVVEAQVSETYTLQTGDVASREPRQEDIVLYRRPVPSPVPAGAAAGQPSLYATLPIAPSRSYDTQSLKEGKVHLDILAGRESVRGGAGGSQAVTVQSGDAILAVASGALPEDTAVDVSPESLSPFLPSGGGLIALEQVGVDFSGKVLSSTAQLSVGVSGGVTPDDTILVAEVVRVDDVPRLVVVALAQVVVDRIVSKPAPGLPGIVEGGDYVFYRSAPVGFISGITSSTAGPVKSVVTTDASPFLGYSKNDGSYVVAARPGTVLVSAKVPKTSLVGSGSVTALGPDASDVLQTVPLDVTLSGQVTTATVTPADGSVAVPTNIQIQIDSTAALNPTTATAANVSLTQTTANGPVAVPVRLILSGSGRSLAVIPQSALLSKSVYGFSASGLADVYGGLVQVPTVGFTTKDNTPPPVNPDALTFSFPDENGLVSVTARAGSFTAGSEILIIDSGNGVVVTFTVDNDGAVGLLTPAQFPASISDELMITITDPLGNVTTFTKSQFVNPATGETAVGTGGGTVKASDGSGVELRIPEGALDKGTTFKISTVSADDLQAQFPDQKPDVPGGTVGSALKIEASGTPTFKKEVKLAFPLPDFSKGAVQPDRPENAFYYVYRRLQGPQGLYAFDTVDEAAVEKDKDGNPTKIVTKSYPYPGYANSSGSFDSSGLVQSAAVTLFYMAWSFAPAQPAKPLVGVVKGRVTIGRQTATGVDYVGLPGILVRGRDAGGGPLPSAGAISQADGSYILWDGQYTGGPVTVQASYKGQTLTGNGYEANAQDDSIPETIRLYRNIAIADVTFPPEPAPAPPPQILIQVMKLVNGQRQDTQGLVAVDTPVLFGLTTNLTIQSASIRVGTAASQNLSLRGPLTDDPSGFTYTAEDPNGAGGFFTPGQSGTYTLTTTGVPAFGPPVTQTLTFRVTGAGGGVDTVPGPPAVITARTTPKANEKDVPVDVLPQMAFTEPVKNLFGNVLLSELDSNKAIVGSVPVTLLGVAPNGQPATVAGPDAVVTGLTVQPAIGLKFSTRYRLSLTNDIVDLDLPTANKLVAYDTEFTTFGPSTVGSGGTTPSPGIVVLGDRAYLVQNSFSAGQLKAYDISRPASPTEIQFDATNSPGQTMEQATMSAVAGRPVDIAGEAESPLGDRVVVIATTSTNVSKPSNLDVFDVSDDLRPHWIGAASVTASAVEGTLVRVKVVGGKAYAITNHKGLQVVDLQQAVADLRQATNDQAYSAGYWNMVRSLGTDGQGFGQDAVQVTIPVNQANGKPYFMADLEVANLFLDNVTQPLMLATGQLPLAIGGAVQPGGPIFTGSIADAGGKLAYGQAIGFAHIASRDIVAIAGSGYMVNAGTQTPGLMFATVDVTDPRRPTVLRVTMLDASNPAPSATDLVIKGTLALVATATDVRLVSLDDPRAPVVSGVLQGIGGILALGTGDQDGLLFATAHSIFGGTGDPLQGVHDAALTPEAEGGGACQLLDLQTPTVELDLVRDPLNQTLCGNDGVIVFNLCKASHVSLTVDGTPLQGAVDGQTATVANLGLAAGVHVVSVPAATLGGVVSATKAFQVQAQDDSDASNQAQAPGTIEAKIRNRSVLPVGHTFVKGVDLYDGHMVRQGTDIRVRGRHLGLEVTRSYSSAGTESSGVMGAGWSFNYGASLTPTGCGLYSVTTADGSSQTFRTSDGGQTFTPQKGYHTRLVKNGDGSYDFFDKSHTRHHFRELEDTKKPFGALRLDYFEEPHGDRIAVRYDITGRVSQVVEIPQETGAAIRSIVFTYKPAGGFDRLASADAPGLGYHVDYAYDDFGNLITVTRSGANVSGPAAADQVEQFRYTDTDVRDRHQMTAARDANGNWTEYHYYAKTDTFPGETTGASSPGLLIYGKEEYVREVWEYPTDQPVKTGFSFDYTQATSLKFKTTVTDALGRTTLYTMNGNGSPLTIDEPLGKTTTMEWATDDILKMRETDALARVTDYGYDANGNLTSETVRTADYGNVVTSYTYDATYNKLTSKTDANTHKTTYTIDPTAGDLTQTLDGAGNVTGYAYNARGLLTQTTDPRQHTIRTTQFDSNGFGLPAEMVNDATGVVTTRQYDSRGRLTQESDSTGHDTVTVYDGLDRVVSTTKKAGTSAAGLQNANSVTSTDYWPDGQPKLVTNPNGARTSYVLDGLNRVVETDTTGPGISGTIQTLAGYDGVGNKTSETDARGVKRTLVYDDLNRLTEVDVVAGPDAAPTGKVAGYSYDLVGNKKTETDVAQQTTTFEYDGLYRVKKKLLPEMNPSTGTSYFEMYGYDKVGDRLSATDANGHQTTYEYNDGLNRQTLVRNALGHTVATSYDDPEGSHVNKSQDLELPKGLRTRYSYDGANREASRVVTLEGAGSNGETYTTSTAYDDTNHTVTVTDPRGFQALVKLDGLDRPIERTVDPSGLALTTAMGYDGLGGKTAEIDPRGHQTSHQYDGLGRLTATTDALSHQTTYAYDGSGLKTRETDRRSVVKHFTYDNLGRPRRSTVDATISGVPWSHEVQYDDPGLKRTEIDARGKQTVTSLDTIGRVQSVKDAMGFTASMAYDGVNKVSETDKRGNTAAFQYDALNRLTKTTDPAPFATQTYVTSYDDANNRRTETDRRGILKVTQTDPLGRVLSITRAKDTPDGAVLETNVYDGNGNKTSAKDAEAKETRFAYDAANRLSSRTEGFGTADAATTTFAYDGAGNQTEEKDQRAADLGEPWSVKKTYDELNRLETVTDGEQDVTTYGYDNEGNKTSVTEPEGAQTTYAYDELGKLLTVTQPTVAAGTPVTTYAYDGNRNRVSQTDANNHVVAMEYDDLNRLSKMTQDPGGFGYVTKHEYDENGNEKVLTDPKGQTVTSSYDELNRVKTKDYAYAAGDPARPWRHTTSVAYTAYDGNNNLTQVDEHVASGTDPPDTTLTTTSTYDLQDRLKTETSPLPDSAATRTVTYAYYRNGTRKTVTDPANVVTGYTYDGQNRLKTATTAAGLTTYAYWPDDLLKTVTYPNGVVATHGYDKADRLTSLGNAKSGSVVSSYGYTYDKNGNRKTQSETNGGVAEETSYTYDALDRLWTVTYPADATFTQGRVVTYGYDAVGNRVRETEKDPGGQVLADKQGIFDSLNRLKTLDDLVAPANGTAFTWDNNGNQLTKTTAGVTTGYVYDVRDKLVEVDQGTSILSRFQYCYDGKRIKKIGEEGIRDYVYDQTSLLTEYDETGVQKAKYDYGSDRLISLTRTDEGRRYFSFDGLRSVTSLTDDTGGTAAAYHLDAWGNYRFPTELNQSLNRFGLTGHLFDRETGLYFAKARYLDPELGRFLSQDSFLGNADNPPSLHRYFYANDNPTRYVDFTGHAATRAEIAAKTDEIYRTQGQQAAFLFYMGAMAKPMADASNQVAAPITQRLEGVTNLAVPVSYLHDTKGEGASFLRRVQYRLIDKASDSGSSGAIRTLAGLGAAAMQLPAAGNDIVQGLAGVPGRLVDAGSHVKQAVQAESWQGAATEFTQAVEDTAGAAETTIGAILLARGGAKVVEEGRAGTRVTPAESKAAPRAPGNADYANYGGEFDIGDGLRMREQPLAPRNVKAGRLARNKAAGKAHEDRVVARARATKDDVAEQVQIIPNTATGPADFWVIPDTMGKNRATGTLELEDAKASPTAPLTPGQTEGYPLIEEHGGTVRGTGATIPPTKVKIVRPKDLDQ